MSVCLIVSVCVGRVVEGTWRNAGLSFFNLFLLFHSVSRPAEFDAWIDMYGGEDFEKEVSPQLELVVLM